MNEAIDSLSDLTPIGAVLVLAALAQVAITQAAKQREWSKQRTQAVAVGLSAILGVTAALVLGLITGIPDSVIQVVSSILLSVAAVAILGKAIYATIGYVIPDGTDVIDVQNAPVRGRRADRDGVPDGKDTDA